MIILSAAEAAQLSDKGIASTLELWAQNNVDILQDVERRIVAATKKGLRYVDLHNVVCDKELRIYFEKAGYKVTVQYGGISLVW